MEPIDRLCVASRRLVCIRDMLLSATSRFGAVQHDRRLTNTSCVLKLCSRGRASRAQLATWVRIIGSRNAPCANRPDTDSRDSRSKRRSTRPISLSSQNFFLIANMPSRLTSQALKLRARCEGCRCKATAFEHDGRVNCPYFIETSRSSSKRSRRRAWCRRISDAFAIHATRLAWSDARRDAREYTFR
jgi:hypothetical protein